MSDNPYGPDPIELTPQAQAFYDRHVTAPKTRVIGITTPAEPESLWIKQVALEDAGRVNVAPRGSGSARLADSVRGRK